MLRPYWVSKDGKSFAFIPCLTAFYTDASVSKNAAWLYLGLLGLCVQSPTVTRSIPALARLARQNRCTTMKCINELEKRGWIETKRHTRSITTFTVVHPGEIYGDRELYSSKPFYDSMAPESSSKNSTNTSKNSTRLPPDLVERFDTYKDGGEKDLVISARSLRERGQYDAPDSHPQTHERGAAVDPYGGGTQGGGGEEPPLPPSAENLNSEEGKVMNDDDVGKKCVDSAGRPDKVVEELTPEQKQRRARLEAAQASEKRAKVKQAEAQAKTDAKREARKAVQAQDRENRQADGRKVSEDAPAGKVRNPTPYDLTAAFRDSFAKHRGFEFQRAVDGKELAGWKRAIMLYGFEAVTRTIDYVLGNWETVGTRFGSGSEPTVNMFITDFKMEALVGEAHRGSAPRMISQYDQQKNNSRMRGEASDFAESRRTATDPRIGWGKD